MPSSITRTQFQEAIKTGLDASRLPTGERDALWRVALSATSFSRNFLPNYYEPGCPAVQAGLYTPGRYNKDDQFANFVDGFDNYVRDTLKVSDHFGTIKVTD